MEKMEKRSLQILIADLRVEIHYRYPYIEKQCFSWMEKAEQLPDMAVEASDEEIRKEKEEAAVPVTLGQCESICIYRAIAKRLTAFSAFVMHGAVVQVDGEAYVFAARSGVGKTTHTKLWLEYFKGRAAYINGDKPVMRWRDGKLYAYGTPWMGKENFGSPGCAPVRAVCFLERGERNRIWRADDREIVERLFCQVLVPENRTEVIQFMEMMDAMVSDIPFYILKCNISQEAVKTAYEAMRQSDI